MTFSSSSCRSLANWHGGHVIQLWNPYPAESGFQILQLAFLDYQVTVIVEIFHNVVVSFFVVFEDDGFDRRVALDQDTCEES